MSEKLNELKKATMASYLAKAGKVIRADTKIAGDFDDEVLKHMRVANKNHPNAVTPGVEKDPEALKNAEHQMKVNADLRDTFRRSAANRIKGIALAGRRLAKEDAEQIDELKRSTVEESFVHVNGATATTDATAKKHGGTNHTDTKTGTIYKFGNKAKASVFKKKMGGDAHHWSKSDVDSLGEETVNEVSRSTIAKVAQARFNQAQKALKDKNYHEYVTKMKKAIKAGDATTPKTGWSHEEETQPQAGEPIVEVSAQEKYRQIRESKMRNRKGK